MLAREKGGGRLTELKGCNSPHLIAMRTRALGQFHKALLGAKGKCSHCKMRSNAIKVQGGKLFCQSLSSTESAANELTASRRTEP